RCPVTRNPLSGADYRSEELAIGVSAVVAAMTAGSCATWARESGQVRKEAALSGCRGCRRRARPEPEAADTPGDLVSESGRTVHNFKTAFVLLGERRAQSISRLRIWR